MPKIKNKLFLSLSTFIILFSFLNFSYAIPDKCKPEKNLSKDESSLNIWKWQDSIFVGLFARPLFKSVAGIKTDEVAQCQAEFKNLIADGEVATEDDCTGTDPNICYNAAYGGVISYNDPEYFQARRESETAGSLLGMAQLADDYLYSEPPPVNMAYFWNDSIKHVPVLNKALAADTYPHAMINAVLNIWKGIRNVALALMSVILLYIGILIILRKKVNPQLVVTVQYAIPKIVIGLLLIIFSYPIGAIITSLAWTLYHSAGYIVGSIFTNKYPWLEVGSIIGLALLSVIAFLLVTPGIGWASLFGIIIMAVVLLIMYLIIKIKAVIIYLKMVFSTVTAPLEFALGTIPGSESKIMEWFKRMAKYALTLFLMGGVVRLSMILSLMLIHDYAEQLKASAGGFFISMIMPVFVIAFAFGLAINMDKKVASFFGEKPTYKK